MRVVFFSVARYVGGIFADTPNASAFALSQNAFLFRSLLTAGGATFAAFPHWYATMFSAFYLPLLVLLVALIVRNMGFEYRGKRDDDTWRTLLDDLRRDWSQRGVELVQWPSWWSEAAVSAGLDSRAPEMTGLAP